MNHEDTSAREYSRKSTFFDEVNPGQTYHTGPIRRLLMSISPDGLAWTVEIGGTLSLNKNNGRFPNRYPPTIPFLPEAHGENIAEPND